jgi:hypothetical protein
MVDLDTAFGQQLFDVAVRQVVAQIPANGHVDHLRQGSNPAKSERRAATRLERRHILPLCPSLPLVDATMPFLLLDGQVGSSIGS